MPDTSEKILKEIGASARKAGSDGSVKEYSEPKSIYDIALDISEGLARMACAGEWGPAQRSVNPSPCL